MSEPIFIDIRTLEACLRSTFAHAGIASNSTEAAIRAMLHGSRLGVDSHGARLVDFYCRMVRQGQVNPHPVVSCRRTGPATAVVDGDDGLGHLASYDAMEQAVAIAREAGIGAVGVIRSSHFGAAGAYAVAAAEAGMIGFATANADSLVTLFGGAAPFHGTNPLAIAAPVDGHRPWLLDMATSSIPFNRVLLYRSLGMSLPPGTGADPTGTPTEDAAAATMLTPLGGVDFGFKGAALAGLATLLSAVLQGTTLDHGLAAQAGTPNADRPTNLGHFFLAIDPARFVGKAAFDAGMKSYLAALRAIPAAAGAQPVMAPGDREWRVEAQRERTGIPIDPDTARYLGLG